MRSCPSLGASLLRLFALAALPVSLLAQEAATTKTQWLDPKLYHLGDSTVEWDGVPKEPEAREYRVRFRSQKRKGSCCLTLELFHVDDGWDVFLNKRSIGTLPRRRARGDYDFEFDGALLKDGDNEIHVRPRKSTDDIIIGRARIFAGSLRELRRLCVVEVGVHDGQGVAIPARLTVLDAKGDFAPIYYGNGPDQAVRKGICYVARGKGRFEVPEGAYVVHATRGPEYGHAYMPLQAEYNQRSTVSLVLPREVKTEGLVSLDAHIHTLTFSGHGDASMRERMITLAGEALDVAIATDHNHQTDYAPMQKQMQLDGHFRSVVGNEVTTKSGHFNAWPLPAFVKGESEEARNAKRPEWRIYDWVRLIRGIRKKGAQIVVLNHPRWPGIERGPFGVQRLNRYSGDRSTGPRSLDFDGMELVNSTALLDNAEYLLRDWFALLNHGESIVAIGSSDSHTVADAVGQGRNYVVSSKDAVPELDLEEITKNLRTGRSSVSLGIIGTCVVNERFRMGDLASIAPGTFHLNFRVRAASFVRPDLARVYVDGILVARKKIEAPAKGATDLLLDFEIPTPAHDAWVVCLATGEKTGRYWPIQKPYTFAATNPVWLDVDRDGRYESPRKTAERMRASKNAKAALASADAAVCVQLLSIERKKLRREGLSAAAVYETLQTRAKQLGISARPFVSEYLASIRLKKRG